MSEATVRSELSGVEQSESGESKSQSGADKVRAERQRRLEAEPGYKAGKALGQHLRGTSLIMLPFEMALAPVLLAVGGWWLDGHFDTSPWLTIVGIVLGLIVAFRSVKRAIKEVSR